MKKLLLLVISLFFLTSCAGPLYKPGKMKEQLGLTPPIQKGVEDNYWKMEEAVKLYYFINGKGEEILVLHGGPGYPTNKIWKDLNLLNNEYKFVYYHQRGCGKSSRPIDTFSSKNYYKNMLKLTKTLGIKAQLADIEKIRQILNKEKLIIVGHSFGAFLATMYAVEFPERIKKLILISPANVISMPQKDGSLYELIKNYLPNEEIKQKYNEYLKQFFNFGQVFKKSEKELAELNYEFTKYYFSAYQTKGNIKIELPFSKEETGGFLTPSLFFDLGKKHNYTNILKKVISPVLIIHGENDLMPIKSIDDYKNNLLNTTVEIIKNAGHFSYDENPYSFAKVVKNFFKK